MGKSKAKNQLSIIKSKLHNVPNNTSKAPQAPPGFGASAENAVVTHGSSQKTASDKLIATNKISEGVSYKVENAVMAAGSIASGASSDAHSSGSSSIVVPPPPPPSRNTITMNEELEEGEISYDPSSGGASASLSVGPLRQRYQQQQHHTAPGSAPYPIPAASGGASQLLQQHSDLVPSFILDMWSRECSTSSAATSGIAPRYSPKSVTAGAAATDTNAFLRREHSLSDTTSSYRGSELSTTQVESTNTSHIQRRTALLQQTANPPPALGHSTENNPNPMYEARLRASYPSLPPPSHARSVDSSGSSQFVGGPGPAASTSTACSTPHLHNNNATSHQISVPAAAAGEHNGVNNHHSNKPGMRARVATFLKTMGGGLKGTTKAGKAGRGGAEGIGKPAIKRKMLPRDHRYHNHQHYHHSSSSGYYNHQSPPVDALVEAIKAEAEALERQLQGLSLAAGAAGGKQFITPLESHSGPSNHPNSKGPRFPTQIMVSSAPGMVKGSLREQHTTPAGGGTLDLGAQVRAMSAQLQQLNMCITTMHQMQLGAIPTIPDVK